MKIRVAADIFLENSSRENLFEKIKFKNSHDDAPGLYVEMIETKYEEAIEMAWRLQEQAETKGYCRER